MPNDPTEAAWHPHTLRFARTERMTVTAAAELELLTRTPRSDLSVLSSLRDAVTSWIAEADSGKALKQYAGDELNVGDLLGVDALDDVELLSRLEVHGLRVVEGKASAQGRALAYDTVLIRGRNPLSLDEEPDEEHEASEV